MKPKTLRNKADRLFSQIVRSRGECERCGRKPPDVKLETSHVFSRRYAWIRTHLENAFCLCSGCHRYVTANPIEHADFARDRIGPEGVAELFRLRDRGKLPSGFWSDEVERLEWVKERLGLL